MNEAFDLRCLTRVPPSAPPSPTPQFGFGLTIGEPLPGGGGGGADASLRCFAEPRQAYVLSAELPHAVGWRGRQRPPPSHVVESCARRHSDACLPLSLSPSTCRRRVSRLTRFCRTRRRAWRAAARRPPSPLFHPVLAPLPWHCKLFLVAPRARARAALSHRRHRSTHCRVPLPSGHQGLQYSASQSIKEQNGTSQPWAEQLDRSGGRSTAGWDGRGHPRDAVRPPA